MYLLNKNIAIIYIGIIFSVLFSNRIETQRKVLRIDSLGQYNPTELPNRQGRIYNDIWGFEQNGREYAILGNVEYTLFIDVTEPSEPIEIARFQGESNTYWRDFKVYNNYAYGVCDSCQEGMYIYDLSDMPQNVSRVTKVTNEFNSAHNIFIDVENARLYACGIPGTSADLYIYDLSITPQSPTLLKIIDFNTITNSTINFYVHDLFVKDNIAYCSHGYTGFYIWDMADLDKVKLQGDFALGAYNHSSWLTPDKKHAIVAEEYPLGKPLIIVSIDENRNDNSIIVESTFADHLLDTGQSTAHNPFIIDSLLYVSNYEDGLKIYNIADINNPELYAYFDSYPENTQYSGYKGAWGVYPFLPSKNILISDITHGLYIVKLNTEFPNLSAHLSISPTALDSSAENNTIIVTAGIYEHNGYNTQGPITLVMEKINGLQFIFESNFIQNGLEDVNNNEWNISENSTSYSFTYNGSPLRSLSSKPQASLRLHGKIEPFLTGEIRAEIFIDPSQNGGDLHNIDNKDIETFYIFNN